MDKPNNRLHKARIQAQMNSELKKKEEPYSYSINQKLAERDLATKNLLEATKELPIKDVSRIDLEKLYEDNAY